MKRCIRVISLLIVALLVNTIVVNADTFLPPTRFEIESADGNRVFRFEPAEIYRSTDIARAAVYTREGELVYRVKVLRSFAYKSNFFFTEDFEHFVFFPPTGDIAFEIFSRGIMVQRYHVQDLVRDIDDLQRSVSTISWMVERNFSPEDGILTITVADGPGEWIEPGGSRVVPKGETHVFDITSYVIEESVNDDEENETSVNYSEEDENFIQQYLYIILAGIGVVVVIVFIIIKCRRKI